MLADGPGVDAGGGGAGQGPAGEILEVDPGAVLMRDQAGGLDHDMEDVLEVFLAVAADFGGEQIEAGAGCAVHGVSPGMG